MGPCFPNRSVHIRSCLEYTDWVPTVLSTIIVHVLLGFWDFILWYMIPAVYYLFHSYWFGLQRFTETWFIWHNSHCFKVLLLFLLIIQFSLVKFLYESPAIRRMRENAHYCFHVMKISIDFIEIVQHSNSVLFHFFSKLFEWPIAVLSLNFSSASGPGVICIYSIR